MKHRIIPLTLAILLVLTMLSGCSITREIDAAEDKIEQKLDTVEEHIENKIEQSAAAPTADQISPAQAAEIALNHAGLTADQVQYLHTEYEIDDRIPQYDVQFYMDRMEYEYEIHAETGEILSSDRDR